MLKNNYFIDLSGIQFKILSKLVILRNNLFIFLKKIIFFIFFVTFSCSNTVIYNNSDFSYKFKSVVVDKKDKKDEVIFGFLEKYNTVNPILAYSELDNFLCRAIYGTLIYYSNLENRYKGMICKDFEILENGRIFKFYLNENYFFADGTRLTIDDIEYNFYIFSNYLFDKLQSSKLLQYENKIFFKKINDSTFIIELEKKDMDFLNCLSQYYILKKDELSSINSYSDFLTMKNWTSSGIYRIKEFNEDGIILIKNNNYYEKTISSQIIKINYYDDINNLYNDYINKKIDIFFGKYGDYTGLIGYIINNKYFRVYDGGFKPEKIFFYYNLENRDSIFSEKNKRLSILNILYKSKINELFFSNSIFSQGLIFPVTGNVVSGSMAISVANKEINIITINDLRIRKILDVLSNSDEIKKNNLYLNIKYLHLSDFLNEFFYEKKYDIAIFPYDSYPFFYQYGELFKEINLPEGLIFNENTRTKDFEKYFYENIQLIPNFQQKQYIFGSKKLQNLFIDFSKTNNIDVDTLKSFFLID